MTVTGTNAKWEFAPQYAKYQNGFAPASPAKANAVFLANPASAETITIGAVTYKFMTTPAAANDIQLGTNYIATLRNLVAAVNGDTTVAGTAYYLGTIPATEIAAGYGGKTLYLTSLLPGLGGNALTFSTTSSVITPLTGFAGAAHGGAAVAAFGAIAFPVLPTAADTLTVGSTTYTFSASATSGTTIHISSTIEATINDLVVALGSNSAVANVQFVSGHNILFLQAATAGSAGNSSALTTTSTSIKVSAATLLGGQNAVPWDETTLTFNPHRATRFMYDIAQIESVFPQETGILTPTGVYKGGYYMQGMASFAPRLQDSLGWLLLMATGAVTTSVSGLVATHTFTFQTDQQETPWAAMRVTIPGRGNVPAQGVQGFDNKLATFTMNMRPASPLEAECAWEGITMRLDSNPQGWFGNAYEEYQGVPITSKSVLGTGLLTVPSLQNTTVPMIAAKLELRNSLTGPKEEMVLGSYTMDDIVILERALTLEFTYKWNDPELYQRVYTNLRNGTTWSPTPFTTQTANGVYAIDITMQSPFYIPGTTTPYAIRVRANNAAIMSKGNLQLQPGQIVTEDYVATVLNPGAGNGNYLEVILTNGYTTGYALPTEP